MHLLKMHKKAEKENTDAKNRWEIRYMRGQQI